MAIFVEVARRTVLLGKGGRITVPHEIRESMGLEEHDTLMLRVEEARSRDGSRRQIVLWAKPKQESKLEDMELDPSMA